MSEAVASVVCNKCGHNNRITVWPLVHAGTEQESLIMDGMFFCEYCEECGEEIYLDYPITYYDQPNKTVILYTHDEMEAVEAERFIRTKTAEDGVVFTTLRLTNSQNELREKVILHKNNLDDRIIELVKYSCLEYIRDEGHKQYFEDVRCSPDKNGDLVVDFIGDKPRHIVIDQDFYNMMSKQYRFCEENKNPLRVDVGWAIEFLAT